MKKIAPIKIRGADGIRFEEVDTYYVWTKKVGETDYEFALHADPEGVFPRKLYISEVSTGCTTRLGPIHPKYRVQLTESALFHGHSTYIPGAQIKKMARSSLHGSLARMGHEKFQEAIDMARVQIMFAQGQQVVEAMAEKGVTIDMGKVKEAAANMDFTAVEQRVMASLTPEQQAAARANPLDPAIDLAITDDKLARLIARRNDLQEQWDVFTKTPDELDRLDEKLAKLDEQIAILESDPLVIARARLDYLTDLREQHGTMTGDTTEHDFEEICDNIATLECEIAELEAKKNGA